MHVKKFGISDGLRISGARLLPIITLGIQERDGEDCFAIRRIGLVQQGVVPVLWA